MVIDVTCNATDEDHAEVLRGSAVEAVKGAHVHAMSDRTFLHAPGRDDRDRAQGSPEDARRPLDGLHAGRGAHLQRHRQGPLAGAQAHDQAQHGRRRHRRFGGARAWATSDPRRRCRSWRARRSCSSASPTSTRGRSASTPRTRTRSFASSSASPPSTAASTSRTSPPRAASRSRRACASCSTSRSSTTTSTARRRSSTPPCSTRCVS